jgi:hypothetical protein
VISVGALRRLVRPHSYALALGLSLMFSEVCIPLITWCLRAPLLYSMGLVSLARPHQPRLWCGCHRVRRELGPWCFDQKLDSEDDEERSRRGLPEGTSETYLSVGKAQGYPRSCLTRSLALTRDSLCGAPRTKEKLACFSIPR